MGWHLIQNKENYMKKKDLILAGAVLPWRFGCRKRKMEIP